MENFKSNVENLTNASANNLIVVDLLVVGFIFAMVGIWVVTLSFLDKRDRRRNSNFEADHAASEDHYFRTVVLPKIHKANAKTNR